MKKIHSLIFVLSILIAVYTNISLSASAQTYTPVAKVEWNGHTYHVYDVSMTWEEAKQYCESLDGHLISITSEEENRIISNTIRNSNYTKSMYWLGGYKEGNWKWITNEIMDYTNWEKGEPTNTQNCLAMYTDLANNNITRGITHGKWLDNPNNGVGSWSVSNTGFICEFEGTNKNNEIKICISGTLLATDQPPVIENGRTLVPLRAIVEKGLQMHISWLDSSQSIVITDKNKSIDILLQIDNKKAIVNNESYILDQAPTIKYDRTYVPVRFIAEALGYYVDWDTVNRIVRIYEKYYTYTKENNETVQIPVISYETGDYADTDILLSAIGDFDDSVNNSKLEGIIKVWDTKAESDVASVHIPYNLHEKKEDGEHKFNIKVNGKTTTRNGLRSLRFTKNNGSAFVHLHDLITLKGFAINHDKIINTTNTMNKITDSGVSFDPSSTSTSVTLYVDWKSTYPTKTYDAYVVYEGKDKVSITPRKKQVDGNSYRKSFQITYDGKNLTDFNVNITILADNQMKTFNYPIRFKTDMNKELAQAEEDIKNEINVIWENIYEKLEKQMNTLYLDVFNDAYTITTLNKKQVQTTDTVKAVKFYFGKKYFEYLKTQDPEDWDTLDESTLIKKVFKKTVEDGAVDINSTETYIYNGKQYSIYISGFSFDSTGCYMITVNSTQSYLVCSNLDAITYALYKYRGELEGLYDTAVQDCMNETITGVGKDFLGLDNLNKILSAWVNKSIWGNESIDNEFIDVALNGLTKGYEHNPSLTGSQKKLFSGNAHTDLNKLCDMTNDAIKAISDAQGNSSAEKCDKAFSAVNKLTDYFGGWKVILQ